MNRESTSGSDASESGFRPGLRRLLSERDLFVLLVTLLCLAGVAATLTPSSYGRVLRSFGVEEDGVFWGQPRKIRSDESQIWTPTIQAVVANDFGQTNRTSPYDESLRTFYAMPLADWGLVFKPQFWAFFVLPPACAYAFYFLAHTWLFLVGYHILFQRLGWSHWVSLWSSLLLYFSAWVQLWWTSLGPLVALLPWGLLLFLRDLHPLLRWAGASFLTACWLLSGQFYPPFLVVLCLAGAALLIDRRPHRTLQGARILATLGGIATGALIAYAYLREPLALAIEGTNHGARSIGGGGLPLFEWLSQFQPAALLAGYEPLHGGNACAISTAGSVLWVLGLCLLDWKSLRSTIRERPESTRCVAILFVLMAFTAWMLLPFPAALGKPLLLHKITVRRLLFSSGLLWLALALVWLPHLRFRWSLPRLGIFSSLIIATWLPTATLGRPHSSSLLGRWAFNELFDRANGDLYVIGLALAAFFVRSRSPDLLRDARGGTSVLAVAALSNVLAFSAFNPLQSAKPIFDRPRTPKIEGLQALQDAHPRGWLVLGGSDYGGSVLNGYGFRSINHTFLHPQTDFFKRIFPSLSEREFHAAFDRYCKLQLASYRPPDWKERLRKPYAASGDATLVPYRNFLPPLPVTVRDTSPTEELPRAGTIFSVDRREGLLHIRLRAEIDGNRGHSSLDLHLEGGGRVEETWIDPRRGRQNWQEGARLMSEVELVIAPEKHGTPRLCLQSHDPELGDFQLKLAKDIASWCGDQDLPHH